MTERRSRTAALVHPILTWRRFWVTLAERADAEARAAGLTVEIGPRGVRRYRDPRLDQITAHRADATEARDSHASHDGHDLLDVGWSR